MAANDGRGSKFDIGLGTSTAMTMIAAEFLGPQFELGDT